MPEAVKPVTGSLKVALKGIGEGLVGLGAVELVETLGAIESKGLVICVAAVLPLPAASVATFGPISTDTDPWPAGVTLKQYMLTPQPAKLAPTTEPLPTVMPEAVKPETDSLKVALK